MTDANAATADAPLRFTTTPTTSDMVWNAASLMQRSRFAMVVGGFNTTLAALGLVRGDVVSVILLLLGLSFLTGLFVAPFVWWAIRQRRELVLAPVTFTADVGGLDIESSVSHGRQDWSVYRRANETDRAFVLDTGIGAAVVITKRGLAPASIHALRALLARVGLGRTTPDPLGSLRQVGWIIVGVAGAAFIALGPRIL